MKASHPHIVIIILTDYDLPEYREAAHDGGADGFIAKGALSLEDVGRLLESMFPGRVLDSEGPARKTPC
jgi:DNA-binding NarL/FixJ family response regulator